MCNKLTLFLVLLLPALSVVEGRSKSRISRPNKPQRPGRRALKMAYDNSKEGAFESFEFALDNEGMPDTLADFTEFAVIGEALPANLEAFPVAGPSKKTSSSVARVYGSSKGDSRYQSSVQETAEENEANAGESTFFIQYTALVVPVCSHSLLMFSVSHVSELLFLVRSCSYKCSHFSP
jgi:hypothetical protein